jgi:hypothetical protein
MLRHAHFYTNGGEPSLAAHCTNGSYAQIVYFAKSRERTKRAQWKHPATTLDAAVRLDIADIRASCSIFAG